MEEEGKSASENESEAPVSGTSAPEEEEERGPLCRPFGPFLKRRRIRFVLGFAFLIFHAVAVLIKGAPPPIRDALQPPVWFYVEGMRMAATWGMFGSYHKPEAVYAVGVDKDGIRHPIYPQPDSARWSFERLMDGRLRKMQSAYAKDEKRNRARLYAAYWCKHPRAGLSYETVRIEKGASIDETKAPRELMVAEGCTARGHRIADRQNRQVRAQREEEKSRKEKRDEQEEIE